MDFNCTTDSFWLFGGCEEVKFRPLYLASFVVVAFHMNTGMFQSVRPEHRADYALGSHAIFHLERQGMLATRLTQILWMLAALFVNFLQAYIGREFLGQLLVWISETSPWNAPEDNERIPFLKTLSIYFNLTLLLGLILLLVLLSIHWVIVFAGLSMWRPKDLRDEEAGIEMITFSADDSSLEVQDQNSDTETPSDSSEGNHDFDVNRRSSANRSTGSLVEDDPVRSTDAPPPN